MLGNQRRWAQSKDQLEQDDETIKQKIKQINHEYDFDHPSAMDYDLVLKCLWVLQ